MGKYFQSQAAPVADPQIWAHTKQMEDGLGGGSLVATGLVAGSTLKKGALIYWDGAGSTRNVYPVKNALVVTGGTTTAPRVAKNHLFKVGDFGFVSGDAVTINSIDTSNAAYDVITFSAACTGAAAGAYIEQAVAAGATPAVKYNANAILGESIYDVQGGEPCTVVLWIFQAIEKSRLPYAASALRLANLSNLKFV